MSAYLYQSLQSLIPLVTEIYQIIAINNRNNSYILSQESGAGVQSCKQNLGNKAGNHSDETNEERKEGISNYSKTDDTEISSSITWNMQFTNINLYATCDNNGWLLRTSQ